ncbi:MAG: SpoIIE family protein phosphatase [Planctomycetota bacterium]|jgi:sigma-B regulation protein RsbU (phosphoserine phosphatase)
MRIVPRDWPIAWRITGGLLIAGIVPLVIVSILAARRGSQVVQEGSFRKLHLVARVTAARIDQFVEDYRTQLSSFRHSPLLLRYLEGEGSLRSDLEAVARVVAERDPGIASLFFTDLAGNVTFATAEETSGKNISFRRYWQQAREGREFVSTLLIGKHTGKPGVYVSGPIRREDGPILGVAVLKVDATVIERYIREVELGERGGVTLLDHDDVILCAADPTYRFHSIVHLTPEQIERINPKKRWGIDTIDPAPLAEAEILKHDESGETWRATIDGEEYFAGEAHLENVAWTVMAFEPRSQLDEPVRTLIHQQIGAIVIVVLITVLFVFSHSRSILRPVRRLSNTAERIAAGDLDARAEIVADDEIGRLARVFNEMVPQLQAGTEMRHSLRLAQEVQQNLLPNNPPDFPGVEMAGHSVPADETGGDYYDFMDLRPWGDDRLAVVVGDVVGHGVAAALLMATARANLRARARPLGDLEPLFNGLNGLLGEDVQKGQFMTMLFLVFDPANRTARWLNAGHHPPFHLEAKEGAVSERTSDNIPLGVVPDWEFKSSDEIRLENGDVLLLGTDGIWEAVNPQNEQFGQRRVAQVLQNNRDKSAREIVDAMMAELARFREGVPFHDDVTMVVMKIT